jgi:hypothetical protein
MRFLLVGVAFVAATGIPSMLGNVAAQSARPYAGMQARARSADQIADLKAGRGMSLAACRRIEWLSWIAPCVGLGDQLGLSDQQRADVQRLFDAMTAEAIPLGEKLVAQEAELDALFARRAVTATSLGAATAAIGAIQAELRNTHLKYHLLTSGLLTAAQLQRYSELRGYVDEDIGRQHRANH